MTSLHPTREWKKRKLSHATVPLRTFIHCSTYYLFYEQNIQVESLFYHVLFLLAARVKRDSRNEVFSLLKVILTSNKYKCRERKCIISRKKEFSPSRS
jgi:hypothetical protein